jgi:agmatine/peptidylarginine deiminase
MRLPAEWERQSGVQMTWPDESTPWYDLPEVQRCYARIAEAILRREALLMVTADEKACRARIAEIAEADSLPLDVDAIRFVETPVNDTWARDHGGIAVFGDEGEKYLYDFVFNGWGLKFASDLDNQITRNIFYQNAFQGDVLGVDMRPYVLEGGSIDCDGKGTLLTTSECLLSVNRNEYLSREEIEGELKQAFGLDRILWLEHGGIAGDDTDSHVDILARFAPDDTIVYTACDDPSDENYAPLKAMEEDIRAFRTPDGKPYRLIPLPLPEAMYLEDYRLPASYANFLVVNGAVLVPGAGSERDKVAEEQIAKAFPGRDVEVIDCRPLLSGHGGLHCVTMNFPEGYMYV